MSIAEDAELPRSPEGTQASAAEPPSDPSDEPDSGRGSPTPQLTAKRSGLVPVLLTIQLAALPVLIAVFGTLPTGLSLVAWTLPVASLAAVPIRSRHAAQWIAVWARWRRRIRRARRAGTDGVAANPLWVLTPQLRLGGVKGPWSSEIGLLRECTGWTSAVWVTSGDRPPDGPEDDGVTRLFALTPPVSPAVEMRAVLQQSSPETGGHTYPAAVVSAWLVLHVDPLRVMPPREAVGAVPALLRSEMRSLLEQTTDGALRLVVLDRSDLVGALAASAEIPLEEAPAGEQAALETWRNWRARGRWHESFLIRPPGPEALPSTVGLLLDGAMLFPGTTVTVCAGYPPPADEFADRADGPTRRADPFSVTVRISHRRQATVSEVVDRLQSTLRERGVRPRGLGGLQGPAVLDTSVLAGRGLR